MPAPAPAPSFGAFAEDGLEFVVATPATPRDWYNYLWNERYVALFSHTGQGEALRQDRLGRRIPGVAGRMAFLRDRDSGAWWSLNGLPIDATREAWRCRHGMGFSVIEQHAQGIASAWRCLVPREDTCEVWTITLQNTGTAARRLQLFVAADTAFDGVAKPQAYFSGNGGFDPALRAVVLSRWQDIEGSDHAFSYLASGLPVAGHDAAASGFIGHGTLQHPDAVARGACAGTGSEMEKAVFALEIHLDLAPGEELAVPLIAGVDTSRDSITATCARWREAAAADREQAALTAAIGATLGSDRMSTGDAARDHFAGVWVKRQISLGTQWARVRHNGYRDQMQDIGGMALYCPAEAQRQLHRVLGYQYATGYAPRTWIDGAIKDNDFSDNHVWIPATVRNLVVETGDRALLDEVVPFNDGSSASVYEHVRRAVAWSWNDCDQHGLVRMRSGDWNDCMNAVGKRGHGVSVWLSMAWCHANDQLVELARISGRADDARIAAERGTEMRRRLAAAAWDGAWYVRAFDDDGGVLGSARNAEGTLFLLPQAWAVIAELGDDERARTAMDAVDRLLEIDLGTTKVLHPYTRAYPGIGFMGSKTPGTHENGGVYLHASAFKLVADCMLKRHDRVEAGLQSMLPMDRTRWAKRCEPYVFCNSWFAIPGSYRYGTAGQSWGTGTAAWFHLALMNHVFGLRPTWEGLTVDPCLPPGWPSCTVERTFRGTRYRVRFDQRSPRSAISSISVDGATFTGTILPSAPGRTLDVLVVLG